MVIMRLSRMPTLWKHKVLHNEQYNTKPGKKIHNCNCLAFPPHPLPLMHMHRNIKSTMIARIIWGEGCVRVGTRHIIRLGNVDCDG